MNFHYHITEKNSKFKNPTYKHYPNNSHNRIPQTEMNPYLMGGSTIPSNTPLMVFTGTYSEHSVENYLNTVTANMILNIGPEPLNKPLHQNWIHRRAALVQNFYFYFSEYSIIHKVH